jgi:chromosome partitioning protein
MLTLCFASAKGGVGKTTHAAHLACEAARSGQQVIMLDTDPQQSLMRWWQARKAETPLMGDATATTLKQWQSVQRRRGVDLIVVDTQPTISRDLAACIEASDLVIVPTRPSPHDLHAISSTIAVVEAARKPMVFLLNGAAYRARINADAIRQLSQHGPVASPTIYQRTDYASSMIDGRTVQELDAGGKSATEVCELWQYVQLHARKLAAKQARMHAMEEA